MADRCRAVGWDATGKKVRCILDMRHYREGGPDHEMEDGTTRPVQPTIGHTRPGGETVAMWLPQTPDGEQPLVPYEQEEQHDPTHSVD
jgi:hypothetical protein